MSAQKMYRVLCLTCCEKSGVEHAMYEGMDGDFARRLFDAMSPVEGHKIVLQAADVNFLTTHQK